MQNFPHQGPKAMNFPYPEDFERPGENMYVYGMEKNFDNNFSPYIDDYQIYHNQTKYNNYRLKYEMSFNRENQREKEISNLYPSMDLDKKYAQAVKFLCYNNKKINKNDFIHS